MAQITMNTDKVKEMCDSAIEYYGTLIDNPPLARKEYLAQMRTLRRIKTLAENTETGAIWISDSDMELMSKKSEEVKNG